MNIYPELIEVMRHISNTYHVECIAVCDIDAEGNIGKNWFMGEQICNPVYTKFTDKGIEDYINKIVENKLKIPTFRVIAHSHLVDSLPSNTDYNEIKTKFIENPFNRQISMVVCPTEITLVKYDAEIDGFTTNTIDYKTEINTNSINIANIAYKEYIEPYRKYSNFYSDIQDLNSNRKYDNFYDDIREDLDQHYLYYQGTKTIWKI